MASFYRTVRAEEPQLRPAEVELTLRGRRLVQLVSIALTLGAWTVVGRVDAQAEASDAGLLPTTAFLETLDVRVVSLEVFVTDRKGVAIEGLQREDFEVLHDGEPVELSHFAVPRVSSRGSEMEGESEPAPDDGRADPDALAEAGPAVSAMDLVSVPETEETVHVVLFVDQMEISPPNRQRILDQVQSFVEDAPPRTRFLVASYDGQVKIAQEFTEQSARVTAALESLVSLSPRALARQAERRALLREGQEVLRTIGQAQRATNAAQFDSARNLAQSQLTSLMGQVERYAQRLQSETERGLSALEGFSTALAALPGRKALVHVSEGIAMRPGQELFYAMEEIFQGGRSLDFGNQGQGGNGGGGGGQGGGGQGGGGQGGGQGGGGGGGGVSFDSEESLNVASFATRAERYSLDSEVRRFAALANTHRVAFYGIDARGGRAFANDASMTGRIGMLNTDGLQAVANSNRWETLQVLAEETGGALLTGADVDGFLRKVQADFGAHYSLAYASPTTGDGQAHEVEVRLRRKGDRRLRRARLRYRRSFVDQPLASRMAARTKGTLLLESDRNPHGIYLETLEPKAGEKKNEAVVPLVVKIPLEQVTLLPRGSVHGCRARLLVAIEDENGFTGPVQEIPFTIEIPNSDLGKVAGQDYSDRFYLFLEPGSRRRLSVGFWDETGGEGSFVRHEVSVGEL